MADKPLVNPEVNTKVAQGAIARVASMTLWLMVPYLVFYKTYVLAFNFPGTDDFHNLYLAMHRFVDGIPVYNEIYHHVDPHYLYSPGATLLLSPFGYVDTYWLARNIFISINAISILVSLALLTKLFGFSLKQFVFPASIVLLFITEGATHTLQFGNLNGVVLLGITVFFWCFIKGPSWLGALALGCAILFKPMFLPFVILPLIARKWGLAFLALATPLALNAIAWPLVPQASDYLTRVAPYLKITRDYANCSIAGVAVSTGMPQIVYYLWWSLVAVAAGVTLVVLSRWRFSNTLLWLVSSGAIMVVAVGCLSNLGQAYYSIFTFPIVFTVFHYRSLVHNPFVIFTMISFHSYFSYEYIFNNPITYPLSLQFTVAWSLFIITSAVVVVSWWRSEDSTPERSHNERIHSPNEGAVAKSTL